MPIGPRYSAINIAMRISRLDLSNRSQKIWSSASIGALVSVPELTRSAGIQLNKRVRLRVVAVTLPWTHEKTAPDTEAQRGHFETS
jgi:hypothetical protein